MKEYKLIKEYPGSPKLGTISSGDAYISPNLFKNNPEFWEEVIEKDYEILSFKNQYVICYQQKDGKFSACKKNKREKGHLTAEEMIICRENYHIHSIKRLS